MEKGKNGKSRSGVHNQRLDVTVCEGMFIGSGFILPGVSGGALAAVFGMYERLISF